MKLTLLILFVLFLIFLSKSFIVSPSPDVPIKPESEIFTLINFERAFRGISPLKIDDQLSSLAYQRACDLAKTQQWSHMGYVKYQPRSAKWFWFGENMARNFTSPRKIVEAWLESPSHRNILLDSRYEDTGIAVCKNYVIQFFVGNF